MTHWIVSQKEEGMSLQNFLKDRLEGLSGKAIKTLIDRFGCKVNGKVEAFSSYKVHLKDRIEIDSSRLEKTDKPSLSILYECEHYWVCNKGAHTLTDEVTFKKILKAKNLFLVHRLDKETSGVIIVAKDLVAKKAFEHLFKEREVHKTYHALCQGFLKQNEFSIENYLGKKSTYQGQAIWGQVPKSQGLYALTHFNILKQHGKFCLAECEPVTGRTHQIRVHLFEYGLPILGDAHYAKKKHFSLSAPRVMLHAKKIVFKDPMTSKEMSIEAPYPEDFAKLLDQILS